MIIIFLSPIFGYVGMTLGVMIFGSDYMGTVFGIIGLLSPAFYVIGQINDNLKKIIELLTSGK